jgi:hypothetical protein
MEDCHQLGIHAGNAGFITGSNLPERIHIFIYCINEFKTDTHVSIPDTMCWEIQYIFRSLPRLM